MEEKSKPDPSRLEDPLSVEEVLDTLMENFPENLAELHDEQAIKATRAQKQAHDHDIQEFRDLLAKDHAGNSDAVDQERQDELRHRIWQAEHQELNPEQ